MATDDTAEMEAIVDWFAERGLGLRFSLDEDEYEIKFVWADLTRRSSDEVVAPMFGRGATMLAAARRARQRYEVEQ